MISLLIAYLIVGLITITSALLELAEESRKETPLIWLVFVLYVVLAWPHLLYKDYLEE